MPGRWPSRLTPYSELELRWCWQAFGNASVVHDASRCHLARALAVEQIAGIDAVKQKAVAGIALPVSPDRLVSQAAIGSCAAWKLGIHSRGKNCKPGEAPGRQWHGVDLVLV
jgi:hypothetical protein